MITLINLPQPNSLDDKLDPPLGLMYIAAVLEKKHIPVRIVDLCFIDKEDWVKEIGKADIYGMTVFSASFHIAKEVYNMVKWINPKCKVVVGGPHPTSLPMETLKSFDQVIMGEGENADFEGMFSVAKMPKIANLDDLPLPARHLIEITRYHRKLGGRQATSMMTSRGCPYSCSYCCKDVFGSKVRMFSVERVVKEIKDIIDNYNIRSFIFYDDTFTLVKKRLHKLCKALSKLNITFRCNGDSRRDTLEDFKLLYKAGCREICFGIESGSQTILDKIHKGVTVERNKQAIREAKEAGLTVKTFLMIGNPGETRETIEETKQFIIDADPDQYTLFNFVPYPGCDIWNNPKKYNVEIVNRDFSNYFSIAGDNEGGAVINTAELTSNEISGLRQELVEFLNKRGQRGKLQDYYDRTVSPISN